MNPLFISGSFVQRRSVKNRSQLTEARSMYNIYQTSQGKDTQQNLWKSAWIISA